MIEKVGMNIYFIKNKDLYHLDNEEIEVIDNSDGSFNKIRKYIHYDIIKFVHDIIFFNLLVIVPFHQPVLPLI